MQTGNFPDVERKSRYNNNGGKRACLRVCLREGRRRRTNCLSGFFSDGEMRSREKIVSPFWGEIFEDFPFSFPPTFFGVLGNKLRNGNGNGGVVGRRDRFFSLY